MSFSVSSVSPVVPPSGAKRRSYTRSAPAGPATDGSDGIPDPDLQRALSAPFVLDPRYGTRCSTLVLLEPSGALRLHERRFAPDGGTTGETELTLNDTQWP